MNKSFTLIEILVVIVIVGILSAFIIVSMAGVSSKAAIAKGQAFSNSIKNSLMMSLVSEWRLDDASGTTIQDQWGTNPGTWYGSGGGDYTSPSWRTSSECVSNGCLAFDGTDDYVDCGIATKYVTPNSSAEITIEAWVKVNIANPGRRRIININKASGLTAVGLHTDTDNTLGLGYNTTANAWVALSSGITPTVGNWYHLVGMKGGTAGETVKVYVNGVLKNTATNARQYVLLTEEGFTSYIGTYIVPVGQCFNGLIDDVRIYNAAVPNSRIQENYYASLNRLLSNSNMEKQEYTQRINQLASN